MTIATRPSRLIGVAERNGSITCAVAPLTVDQLPPWGGRSLEKIQRIITSAARSHLAVPMEVNSIGDILWRMQLAGIPSIEASIYYPGRSYKKHGWRHSILTAV